MVSFTTGVPRSGKSYKAMYTLYSNFAKDKKLIKDKRYKLKDVDKALVNINQIDLKQFNNVEFLDWDVFYDSITMLYNQYKTKIDDDDLVKLAKELKVYGVYIVLDECHNYLDSQDKVLVWWISYHGHLHQEIELITQNLALVNSKYKGFCEFFYRAVPSSRKLFNTSMKYQKFTGSRMSEKDKFGVDTLPIVKEIFNGYSSGKNQKTKSIIHKFLLIALVFFSLLILFSYYLINSKTPSQNSNTPNTSKINKEKDIKKDSTNEDEDDKTLESESDKYHLISAFCYVLKEKCTINTINISIPAFLKLKAYYDVIELSVTPFTKRISKIDLLVEYNFYILFHQNLKEKENEEDNFNGVSISPNINSR